MWKADERPQALSGATASMSSVHGGEAGEQGRGCQPHPLWCSVASSTWQCHTQANQASPDKQKNNFSRVLGNSVETRAWRIIGCHNGLRELLQVTSCDAKETSAAPELCDQVALIPKPQTPPGSLWLTPH